LEVIYNAHFDRQRRTFRFCFTCEDCAHFDEKKVVCLHGFPCGMHRSRYYDTEPKPKTILFCKDFDLA